MKEEEEREKEHISTTIRSVLSRKTNIAIIIGWIITGIAIAFVWIWAMGSPLAILIPVSVGVVLVAVFIVLAITTMRRSEEEEVERIIEILKRAKRIKEEIERRGEGRT
jgi:Mn2+/Fe2+ NRAMP family transporter